MRREEQGGGGEEVSQVKRGDMEQRRERDVGKEKRGLTKRKRTSRVKDAKWEARGRRRERLMLGGWILAKVSKTELDLVRMRKK